MRAINKKLVKFSVGNKIKIIKNYTYNSNNLMIGQIGTIVDISIVNLIDLGLYDIAVLDINFDNCKISIGRSIAEEFIEPV